MKTIRLVILSVHYLATVLMTYLSKCTFQIKNHTIFLWSTFRLILTNYNTKKTKNKKLGIKSIYTKTFEIFCIFVTTLFYSVIWSKPSDTLFSKKIGVVSHYHLQIPLNQSIPCHSSDSFNECPCWSSYNKNPMLYSINVKLFW